MLKLQCQNCATEMTFINDKSSFEYTCKECNKKMHYDSLRPNLYWTLCDPCKTWIGHEKYMTSKCGQVMKTILHI